MSTDDMNICPSCGRAFDEDEKFCEDDGTQLLSEPSDEYPPEDDDDEVERATPRSAGQRPLLTAAVAAAVGGLVVAAAVIIYLAATRGGREAPSNNSRPAAGNVALGPRAAPPQAPPTPTPDASPTATPSPTPQPTPTPPPARPPDDPLAALSTSPASTGDTGTAGQRRLLLGLDDGTSLEVEDAWVAPDGVWYRRGGIVARVDRERVSSVRVVSPPAPLPTPR